MKVYALEVDSYSNRSVVAVFSSSEKAMTSRWTVEDDDWEKVSWGWSTRNAELPASVFEFEVDDDGYPG